MPARIYALAKELKVDSKDLVDLVKKVGITGKGSALASLSDEEAQKVRDHLSGAGKPEPVAAPTATTAPTAVRDVVPTERKHVAIKVGRSSSRTSAPEKPAKAATPAKAPAAKPKAHLGVGPHFQVVSPLGGEFKGGVDANGVDGHSGSHTEGRFADKPMARQDAGVGCAFKRGPLDTPHGNRLPVPL